MLIYNNVLREATSYFPLETWLWGMLHECQNSALSLNQQQYQLVIALILLLHVKYPYKVKYFLLAQPNQIEDIYVTQWRLENFRAPPTFTSQDRSFTRWCVGLFALYYTADVFSNLYATSRQGHCPLLETFLILYCR